MSEIWNRLYRELKIDSNTVVFEKKTPVNDALLMHLSGGVINKTHVYVRSDTDPKMEDYIKAHELCHHYLIYEKGYWFFFEEKNTENPLFSLIMSFSHHFSIDNILKSCGFDIIAWHQKQYSYCKAAAKKGFTSDLDAIGKTLNLIELNYWLNNNVLTKYQKQYIQHNPKTAAVFKFYETVLHELLENGLAFTAEGSKHMLAELHKTLNLPSCRMYCLELHSEDLVNNYRINDEIEKG